MRRSRSRGVLGRRAVAIAVLLSGCGARPVEPAAPSCPTGHTIVASHADVARVAGCTTLHSLTIRSGAALDVSKLRVQTVTGDLVIGPTVAVEEVTLRELRTVGGAIRVAGNGLLHGLYLPALEQAGAIEIEDNASVTTISMPRLEAVHGALHITGNASLELVDLSALSSIDQDLVLERDPVLALVEAPDLRHAAAVRLDLPRLPPEVADRLRAVRP